VVLTVLLLNPTLTFGGLAKVEEVPLTPEEVARVRSLKQVNQVNKEAETEAEEVEAAILVKGEQGRPCILKPQLEGGWKKLCAVFWLPGEEELDSAVNTVTGLFRQSLASLLIESKEANLPYGKEESLLVKGKEPNPPNQKKEAKLPIEGNERANLLMEGNKKANLPAGKDFHFSEVEETNNSPQHKDNLVSTYKNGDSSFGQMRPSENESERRGMDVNVKFTFDDSYFGEEPDNVDVNTGQVPALSEATLDLLERPENGNPNREATVVLPSPRGNKQPVYFEPRQPDLENQKEESYGPENVFGGERSVGRQDKHGTQGTPNIHESLPGNGENVSQLFWLLTSSTETPRLVASSIALQLITSSTETSLVTSSTETPSLLTSSTETPSVTSVKTTTIQPAVISTSTRLMTKQDQTLQEIDPHGAHTTNILLTTTSPFQSRTITTPIAALSPFSLPFLNNPRRPDKESLEDSSEEEKQLSNQGKDKSSSLLATTKDMLEQSSFDIKEQSSFDIKVESEEKGKFGEEVEATVPYVTTTPLPIINLQISDEENSSLSSVDFLKICFFNSTGCDFSFERRAKEDEQSRLESSTPAAFRFILAPYETSTAATRRTTSSPSTSTAATRRTMSSTSINSTTMSSTSIESSTTSSRSTVSSTADVKTVASQVQKRVQACFLTGKC